MRMPGRVCRGATRAILFPDAEQAKARAHSSKEPRAFHMLARVKARSLCLYACDARRCPVLRAGEHGGKTEAVSALQLRALRCAGAHLLRLRPRQPVLRGGVRPDPPARVVVACRGTLPVELPRSVWARCPAAGLARAPNAESDASGFPSQRRAGHSGEDLNADDPGDPCRHCIDSALSAQL